MDLRRRKPIDMQGVRRSRASHTGKVTQVWEKLKALDYLEQEELQRLNTTEVKGYLKTLAKTEAGYTSSLSEALDFAPEGEEALDAFQQEEDEAAEHFTESLDQARSLGNQILGYKASYLGIRSFKSDLEALKASLLEEPDKDYSTALSELRILFSQLREQWTAEELDPTHPLQTELDVCRRSLTTMEGTVSTARTKATPLTAPILLPSMLTKELEPKLPTIDVPTFDGDIMRWCYFWTAFEAAVDSKKLSKPTKLSYLRKAVKDPSSQTLLFSPQESPDFYDEVVKALKLRFNRTKEIHRKLVHNLVSLPSTKNTRLDLRQRVDELRHLLASLKHTGHYDLPSVLTSLVYETLPEKLKTLWDQHNRSNKTVSPVEELLEYVSEHAETLPAGQPVANKKTSETTQAKRPPHRKSYSSPKSSVYVAAPSPPANSSNSTRPTNSASPNGAYRWDCLLCLPEKHPLHLCPKWGAYSISQKMSHVNDNKLCHNCLAGGHSTNACKSYYRCRECKQKHHTSIHQQASSAPVNHSTSTSHQVPDALMTTARLLLIGPDGTELPARALIDSGAGISLISRRVAQMLHLHLDPANLRLSVAQGEVSKPLDHLTSVTLSPLHNRAIKIACRPAVAPVVTSDLPAGPVPSVNKLTHLTGLALADPTYNQPGRIDILLGADMASAILTQVTPRKGNNDEPMAQATVFGWTLSGPVPGYLHDQASLSAYHQLPVLQSETTSEPRLEELLQAVLHEQGETGEAPPVSTQDINQQVEKHYTDTVVYSEPELRYTVELPRKEDMQLGVSKPQATMRFINTERANLRKNVHRAFQEAVEGYLTSGHAEEVPPEHSPPVDSFYLPMHGVYKDSSSSTKLRIVFDGSAATSNGLSLNQLLHGGPTIQATLTNTLMKFRSYPIALNADVGKMFREIKLTAQDKDLHRFVWRRKPSEPLKDYRMSRVTFGISSSPFLAIRTLQQIVVDHGENYPEASHHILSSFYVDDFLGGAHSTEEAMRLFHDLRWILGKGNFQLKKWRSSSAQVLRQIPEDLLEKDPVKDSTATNSQTNSKALGLLWNSHSDVMSPSILTPTSYKRTKRGLVSAVYRTYDILGWISPTTLRMKLMIQKLWQNKHGWDTEAPPDAVDLYQKWIDDLPVLRQKTLTRCYFLPQQEVTEVTLHGFADASKLAYGAVVYYRTCYLDHPPTVSLVTSKTKLTQAKVAKVPKETIPRLELCAALLLANLLQAVGRVLNIPPQQWHAWSDNSSVLCWLDGHPRTHPIYVGNRVDKTLEITPPSIWHHVPTASNPADCASRGLSPSELLKHRLWWEGPKWLYREPWIMPHQPPRRPLPDAGPAVCTLQIIPVIPEQITALNFLTYTAVVSVAAWVKRFCNRIQFGRPTPDERTRVLTGGERRAAELWLFREAQRRAFPKDRMDISNSKALAKGSRLKTLDPFLDDKQLLRIGGRLSNSDLAMSQKHPVILDGKGLLMEKFFTHIHKALCHCGPTLLLCHVGKKLHVLGARRLCRRLCAKCVRCRRYRPKLEHQKMGELPAYRVASSRVTFNHVGIDCAGPFTTKAGRVRNPLLGKAHICVFVCLATKAVHLEVVSEESTAAFQAALDRFIARRGCPSHIFSDNGGNFVGARNDLRGFYKFLRDKKNNEEIRHYLATHHEVTWHNIPARSPHMGGLWEAAVKSMKTHLHRAVGFTKMTYEELNTISIKIEACLNSRPLLPLHSHPTDGIDVLTPGHFLAGRALQALPEDPTPNERPHLLQTWSRCQAMAHHIWTRWSREYLNSLQARTKWQGARPGLQVGDVVIIKPKAHFFACQWPLGRITKIFPGKDNLVRVVEVKTKLSTLKRAVTELALLYREDDESEERSSPAPTEETEPAEEAAPPPRPAPPPQPVQAPSTAFTTQNNQTVII